MRWFIWIGMFFSSLSAMELGVDLFFSDGWVDSLSGKRVGLITNQSGVNSQLVSTLSLFTHNTHHMKVVAIFAPEHGLFGQVGAEKAVDHHTFENIPVYSLYGSTRRPTAAMLQGIDVLVYDIQDIGARSYTYATTLYYVMEEAAKKNIPVWVLDRPNPLGGDWVDGPMLDSKHRSFIGYMDIPYCHGMTVGELARFFNEEYGVHCALTVVPMKGWKRSMSFSQTGLPWVPTSPYIVDADAPFFYATTGLMGQLGLVSIGIGYTLPFRVVGAPWICADKLARALNAQALPGLCCVPFHFIPHYGLYKGESCQGVLLVITNRKEYRPVKVQSFLLGILKSLYPKIFSSTMQSLSKEKKALFCKAAGGEELWHLLCQEKHPAWQMAECQKDRRQTYLSKRKKYLLYN